MSAGVGEAFAIRKGPGHTKNTGEIMETLETFDLVESYRSAAELAGCSHHRVERYVGRRDGGAGPAYPVRRPSIVDGFREKITEWVTRSNGKIRADVVHEKLLTMGHPGSERAT